MFIGSKPGKSLESTAMLEVLRALRPAPEGDDDLVVLGFRSTFSNWANAKTKHKRDAIELALAHTVPGVRGVYFDDDMLEERRPLMADREKVLREADHHQGRQCSHHARTALMPISREATIRSFVRHGMPRAVAEEAVDEIDDYESSGRFLPPSAPGEKATA